MNPSSLQGDRNVSHFRLRALMAAFGFLAGLLPGLAFGASSEPLDLDITVTNVASDGTRTPAVDLPLRVVLDSDKHPRAPGAGQQLVTDADGRIQRELRVKADRRRIWVFNIVPMGWSNVETIKIGFELIGAGGSPILHWFWFDYYTKSASKVSFEYVQDLQGNFVEEEYFAPEARRASGQGDYKGSDKLPRLIPPRAGLSFDKDLWLTREDQPDGSRRWKVKGKVAVVPWSPVP